MIRDVTADRRGSRVFFTGNTERAGVSGSDMVTASYDVRTGRELWFARFDGGGWDEGIDVTWVPSDRPQVAVTGGSEADGVTGWRTVAYGARGGKQRWSDLYRGPLQEGGFPRTLAAAPGEPGSTSWAIRRRAITPTSRPSRRREVLNLSGCLRGSEGPSRPNAYGSSTTLRTDWANIIDFLTMWPAAAEGRAAARGDRGSELGGNPGFVAEWEKPLLPFRPMKGRPSGLNGGGRSLGPWLWEVDEMRHPFENRWRSLFVVVAALTLVAAFAGPATGASGDLDPSFGVGGKVRTSRLVGGQDVAFQANGKIVVGGTAAGGGFSVFAVARFTTDGRLDSRFGGDGVVSVFATPFSGVRSVFVQRDGKIVAVGQLSQRVGLARFNLDGTLDTSFGVGGKVKAALGPRGCTLFGPSVSGALGRHGKIVIATACSGQRFVVARYRHDGTLDRSFSGDGMAAATLQLGVFEDRVAGVAVQPNGKIVVAGSTTYYIPPDGEGSPDFAVLRFNADGTLDDTFGGDGKVATGFFGEAGDLALQPDGKIVVGGTSGCSGHACLGIIRLEPNGTLDPTFGDNGTVTTSGPIVTGADTLSVAIQRYGRIVAGGSNPGFMLRRYQPGGRLDTTFGSDGLVETFGGWGDVAGVAIQENGKIVAVGWAGATGFAMARYLP
jgi:uncharacterized delta-60 repeat protein